MGFAVWIDDANRLVWAQGTQEYRPMGSAVIAVTGQFRHRDFDQRRVKPAKLHRAFVGFFGSLEDVNRFLRSRRSAKRRETPAFVR